MGNTPFLRRIEEGTETALLRLPKANQVPLQGRARCAAEAMAARKREAGPPRVTEADWRRSPPKKAHRISPT